MNERMSYKNIVLLQDWLGHKKGSTLSIQKPAADLLISRGGAMEESEKKKGAEKSSAKALSRPKHDKMLKRPVRGKQP